MIPVCIAIPTFNRQHLIAQAVTAALAQSHPDTQVLVIDDASDDGSWPIIADLARHPRCAAIRLAHNLGTAQAKNVALLFAGDRAVTFHDSDDLPHRDKVLRQARTMAQPGVMADPCLNWGLTPHASGTTLQIGAVLTHHEILMPDGTSVAIRCNLSLIDDVFPNLQMGSRVPGDWTHVNSGLFHPQVFARHGGFADCIEEDREFRNRLILSGEIVWVIPDILLTKIETEGSLTQGAGTDYTSPRRQADRERVWQAVQDWRRGTPVQPCPIDLPELMIADWANPYLLCPSDAQATPQTQARVQDLLQPVSHMQTRRARQAVAGT